MHMVMLVLDNPNQLDKVLAAWQDLGVTGVTIVESSGGHRRRAQQAGPPFMLGFHRLLDSSHEGHYTLFTIVEEEMISSCVEAVEKIVGDLSQPRTGVLAAWPLSMAKGLPKQDYTEAE